MSDLLRVLQEKEKELVQMINIAKQFLQSAPEGSLRINHNKNSVQYYHRKTDKNEDYKFKRSGHYIRKEDASLARALAQKTYDEKLLKAAEEQLAAVQQLLNVYKKNDLQSLYTEMEEERQKLVSPVVIPDEIFRKNWEKMRSQSINEYPVLGEIYTERGEHVRSKSEKILADKLAMMGIPYKYEQELSLNYGVKIYPDFTLLNIHTREEIYYEHFGMMDNPEYQEKALKKISLYEKNGLWMGKRLLCSFETQKMPLDIRNVEQMLKAYIL